MIWKLLRRRRKHVAIHTIDGQLTVELPDRANHPVKADADPPSTGGESSSSYDSGSSDSGGCDGGD